MAFNPINLTNKKKSVGQGLQRTDAFPIDIWQLWDNVEGSDLIFVDPTDSDNKIRYTTADELAKEVAKNAVAYVGFPFSVVDSTGTPHYYIVSGTNGEGEERTILKIPTSEDVSSIASDNYLPLSGGNMNNDAKVVIPNTISSEYSGTIPEAISGEAILNGTGYAVCATVDPAIVSARQVGTFISKVEPDGLKIYRRCKFANSNEYNGVKFATEVKNDALPRLYIEGTYAVCANSTGNQYRHNGYRLYFPCEIGKSPDINVSPSSSTAIIATLDDINAVSADLVDAFNGGVKYQTNVKVEPGTTGAYIKITGLNENNFPIIQGYMYSIESGAIEINGQTHTSGDYFIKKAGEDLVSAENNEYPSDSFTWLNAQDSNDAKLDKENTFTEVNTFEDNIVIGNNYQSNIIGKGWFNVGAVGGSLNLSSDTDEIYFRFPEAGETSSRTITLTPRDGISSDTIALISDIPTLSSIPELPETDYTIKDIHDKLNEIIRAINNSLLIKGE